MEARVERDATLLTVLQELHAQSSTSTLRKMLTQGRVTVNDEVVHRAKHPVTTGDTVRVLSRAKAEDITPPPAPASVDIDVLYEDETLLVVNKPAHQLSVATDRLEADTLHSRCVDHVQQTNRNGWCFIVHRLDRETSGVMVLAKTKEAKRELQSQFADRTVHRLYLALVEGHPRPASGTVRTWLMEDKHLNVKAVNPEHPQGKEAVSHYSVTASDETTSLVDVMIETGRRHQIRMAMQHLGTPVVGDERHGATSNPHGRIMLHANALEFLHPDTDDPVRFEAPVPRGFTPRGESGGVSRTKGSRT
jgi:23S rRNA pseudouridine1911/1915/1917 synthase